MQQAVSTLNLLADTMPAALAANLDRYLQVSGAGVLKRMLCTVKTAALDPGITA